MRTPPLKVVAGGAATADVEQVPVSGAWQKIKIAGQVEAPSFFRRTFTTLYGEMESADLLRVFWFSATLFFIIGGYWLLRSLKDSVLVSINGVEYIPQAKMVSLVVVMLLVVVYNKLLDVLPKHQLFYCVGLFYFVVFSSVAYFLSDPLHGLANTNADPSRLLGWFSYCAIESFGSIGVAQFWAFVNATIDLEGAKKAYGLIIAGAQIGSILGPTLVTKAHYIGVPRLYFVGALCMLLMVLSIFTYVQRFGVEIDKDSSSGSSSSKGKAQKKPKAGVMEGVQLFMKHKYIRGILALSSFEVEVTILDYIQKVLAKRQFSLMYPNDPLRVTDEFASFMGMFGQVTNTMSFLFSLTGTSFIIRNLGLQRTLLAFPILNMVAIFVVLFSPGLWVVFGAMIFLKALSYSLNNPCKEILYNPTSTPVKFKSKSWIDIFGQRGAKALGSVVTNQLSDSVSSLITYGGMVSIGITGFLIYIAHWMGLQFEELTTTGQVVGEEADAAMPPATVADDGDEDIPSESRGDVEMRDMAADHMAREENDGTTCAI